MNTRTNALRSQFSLRPSILGFCIFALGTLFMAPVFGSGTATTHSVYMVSDDINDTATPGSLGERPTDTTDVNSEGEGHGDNGHGNNEDGVDSSNPGQGQGGPNGQVDESCDGTGECVDDESGNGNGRGH